MQGAANGRFGPWGPRIVEFLHVAVFAVDDTTYFIVSLKNGAPGSSSTVRTDHAGSNLPYVLRPSRMASQASVRDSPERLAHPRVEPVLERPRRRVDNPVER